MNLKEKYGLSTDAGFNGYAILVPAMGVVSTMPDSHERSILLAIICIATAIVGYMTKGETKSIDPDKSIQDVLDEGRE